MAEFEGEFNGHSQIGNLVQLQYSDIEGGCLISHLRVLAANQKLADFLMLKVGDAVLMRDSGVGTAQGAHLNWSVNVVGPERAMPLLASLIQQEADLGVFAARDLPYPMPEQLDVLALIQAEEQPNSAYASSSSFHPLSGNVAVIGRTRRPELRALFHGLDIRQQWGKVWLIGFGPGDPELMTLRADRILCQADIIYYDDLIDQAVLARYCGCKKFVGKRKGNHSEEQEAINELLHQSALAGKMVVRLKGGDPFVFGRGGEESEFLLRRMIAVEVIPGVSAVNAAAAASCIPLTKRGISWSVILRTAHCGNGLRKSTEEGQTLVYYMAATRLVSLSDELLAQGLNPETPVALVQKASLHDQQSIATTLKEMGRQELESPVLVIVGLVAGNYHRPRTLLYTGSDLSEFRSNDRLIHYPLDGGGTPRFGANMGRPREPLDLQHVDGIVFTCASAVDNFIDQHGLPPDWILNYALEPAALERLHQQGVPWERTLLLNDSQKRSNSERPSAA